MLFCKLCACGCKGFQLQLSFFIHWIFCPDQTENNEIDSGAFEPTMVVHLNQAPVRFFKKKAKKTGGKRNISLLKGT
jgi:hypothetical protein